MKALVWLMRQKAFAFGVLCMCAINCTVHFASAATTDIPRYPAIIDCSTQSDPLCENSLPPGITAYSMNEAMKKRGACTKGDFRACYELCRRRMNGNRAGFSCPTVLNANTFRGDVFVTENSFACDRLEDVKRGQELDLRDDDGKSFKRWIKSKGNECRFILEKIEAKKINGIDADQYVLVTMKNEHGRERWVEGLFLADR